MKWPRTPSLAHMGQDEWSGFGRLRTRSPVDIHLGMFACSAGLRKVTASIHNWFTRIVYMFSPAQAEH